MYLEFSCPYCGEALNAAISSAGQSIPCSQCACAVVVPAPGLPELQSHEPVTELPDLHTSDSGETGVLLSTCETIPGLLTAETLGVVEGSTVMTRAIGPDFAAGLKAMVGGEIHGYSKLLSDARQVARQRLTESARRCGANAVVGLRYATSSISPGMSELMAYGTAVWLIADDNVEFQEA